MWSGIFLFRRDFFDTTHGIPFRLHKNFWNDRPKQIMYIKTTINVDLYLNVKIRTVGSPGQTYALNTVKCKSHKFLLNSTVNKGKNSQTKLETKLNVYSTIAFRFLNLIAASLCSSSGTTSLQKIQIQFPLHSVAFSIGRYM